jgi:ATP-dependent DNA ligase
VIDGEAVILSADGVSDFDALHSRRHDEEVQLYAFDILALDGEDLPDLPLSMRKTNLARLLARRPDGIVRAGRDRSRPVSGSVQHGASSREGHLSTAGWSRVFSYRV